MNNWKFRIIRGRKKRKKRGDWYDLLNLKKCEINKYFVNEYFFFFYEFEFKKYVVRL